MISCLYIQYYRPNGLFNIQYEKRRKEPDYKAKDSGQRTNGVFQEWKYRLGIIKKERKVYGIIAVGLFLLYGDLRYIPYIRSSINECKYI